MDAGLRKYLSKEKKIINFAAYHAEVVVKEGQFGFKQQIHGMWEMERYISLLMGEIPPFNRQCSWIWAKRKEQHCACGDSDRGQNSF